MGRLKDSKNTESVVSDALSKPLGFDFEGMGWGSMALLLGLALALALAASWLNLLGV